MFRIKSHQRLAFDHRKELHALFLGQKPDFNLESTEKLAKAFFGYLCKQITTDVEGHVL